MASAENTGNGEMTRKRRRTLEEEDERQVNNGSESWIRPPGGKVKVGPVEKKPVVDREFPVEEGNLVNPVVHDGATGLVQEEMDIQVDNGALEEPVSENGEELLASNRTQDEEGGGVEEENRRLKKVINEKDLTIKHLEKLLKQKESQLTQAVTIVMDGLAVVSEQEQRRLISSEAGSESKAKVLLPISKTAWQEVGETLQKFKSLEEAVARETVDKQSVGSSASGSSQDNQMPESSFRREDKAARKKVIKALPQVISLLWKKHDALGLTWRDFLSMGSVSTSWNRGFNQAFNLIRENPVTLTVGNIPEIRRELKKLAEKQNPPYPPTAKPVKLTVAYSPETSAEERDESRSLILRALGYHGANVKIFHYHRPQSRQLEDKLEWYITIIKWLCLMPNLEEIEISGLPTLVLDAMSKIESYVEQSGFPTLEKLKRVNGQFWPECVTNEVLAANPQIEALHLSAPISLDGVTLPQLKELGVRGSGWDLKDWTPLKAPLLEQLEVELRSEPNTYSPLYKALIKVNSTLRCLKLSLKGNKWIEKFPELPALQKLELESQFESSEDVLKLVRVLPALENLQCRLPSGAWVLTGSSRKPWSHFKTRIQKRKQLRKELPAKLWPALPKLKKVEIVEADKKNKHVFIREIKQERRLRV